MLGHVDIQIEVKKFIEPVLCGQAFTNSFGETSRSPAILGCISLSRTLIAHVDRTTIQLERRIAAKVRELFLKVQRQFECYWKV